MEWEKMCLNTGLEGFVDDQKAKEDRTLGKNTLEVLVMLLWSCYSLPS